MSVTHQRTLVAGWSITPQSTLATRPFNNHKSSIRGLVYLFTQLRPSLLKFFKLYLDNCALARERKENVTTPVQEKLYACFNRHRTLTSLYLSNTFPGRPLMLTLTKEHGHSEGGMFFIEQFPPELPNAGKGKTSM